jgi:hypothetical protein
MSLVREKGPHMTPDCSSTGIRHDKLQVLLLHSYIDTNMFSFEMDAITSPVCVTKQPAV